MLLSVCLVSAPRPSSTSVSSPTTLVFSFLTQAHIAFRPCHSGLHKSTCRHHTHTHTEPAKQSAHEQDLRPSLRIPLLKLLKLWPHKGLSTTCLVRMRHLLVGDVLPRFHGQPSLLEMLDPTKSSSDNWTPQPSGTVAWSVTHCCTHLQRTRPCRSKAPPRQRKRVDALLDSTHGVQTAPPNFQTRQEKSEPFARLTCSPRSRVSSHWRATKPLSDRHSSCQL